MYKFIRYFNQNRKKIIKSILIIVFIIAIIQFLNYTAEVNQKNKYKGNKDNIVENTLQRTDEAKDSLISNKSIIQETTISKEKIENEIDVINKFFKYCNNKDINNAYNLLTKECKELMYPTIDDFYKCYYNVVFNDKKKSFTMENWEGSTYQVMITEDILSTGKVNDSITRQDYMTVTIKDGESKLNINNYIGRWNVNKKSIKNNIEVTVVSKDVYMDYEVYNFKITNNLDNKILLDDCQNPKSVYLEDNNNLKYYFYNNELFVNKFIIESKYTKNFQIKFNRSYSSSRKIKKIVFSNVILNYEKYLKEDNKSEYSDKYKLEVDI